MRIFRKQGEDDMILFPLKTAEHLMSEFREIYDLPRNLEKLTEYVRKKREWRLVEQKEYSSYA